jgi:hypothetical protein
MKKCVLLLYDLAIFLLFYLYFYDVLSILFCMLLTLTIVISYYAINDLFHIHCHLCFVDR